MCHCWFAWNVENVRRDLRVMDTGMISALISGLVLIAVVVLYVLMQQIHRLVNSRLTEALDNIEKLQKQVEELGGEPAPPVRDRGDQ